MVRVGEVPKTANPVPVSSDKELSRAAEAAVEERLEEESVNTALEAVKSGRLMTLDPESITIFPVVVPPRVRVCKAVPCKVGVPKRVRAPEMEAALFMVVVPVAAPRLRLVAAPAKLTVVAVVLTRAKVVEGVVMLVVMVGEVPKTATPVPVSSDREVSS